MSEFMFKQDFVNIQITQLQIKCLFVMTCVPSCCSGYENSFLKNQ
ncbi:hypothetical protein [Acinetobacter courvalinii]|uniref:Uncharacterized protein n=1 Tax=Acinetobacter courvalinii TaxID=280147 RepID=A0AA42LAY9_9GAMM|nr:hypothetical protein [Acinetobacter courvalinii]MDH0564579.1 hypothetical protein [Acinetobacter courvalinii]